MTLKGTYPLDRFQSLPTPFYYYDTALLQHTLDTIREQIQDRPAWQVHYAVKANHNPVLLRQIAAALRTPRLICRRSIRC